MREGDTNMTLDMERIAERVRDAGFAAYVEQTGGGCATIFASREWEDRAITRMGVPDTARFPKARDEEGHHDVSAGPGWFDGPHWTQPRADEDEFYVSIDDNGESGAYVTPTTEDDAVEAIVRLLNEGRV